MPVLLKAAERPIKPVDCRLAYSIAARLTVGECSVILQKLGYSDFTFDGYRSPGMIVKKILCDERIRDMPSKRYKVSFYGGPDKKTTIHKGSFAALTADKILRSIQRLGREYADAAISAALQIFAMK